MDRDFVGAYEETGYTDADAGRMDEARSILDYLRDENGMKATFRLTLSRNDSADRAINPSPLVFSFKGKDVDRNEMDPDRPVLGFF